MQRIHSRPGLWQGPLALLRVEGKGQWGGLHALSTHTPLTGTKLGSDSSGPSSCSRPRGAEDGSCSARSPWFSSVSRFTSWLRHLCDVASSACGRTFSRRG